jgi:glutathionyl-hydroquinone reductase
MFFNKIKDFWTKKIVDKRMLNVKHLPSNNSIKNIGIVFDESYFLEKDLVIEELVQKGFHKNNISMLVFKDNIKKTETFTYPVFSYHDLSWIAAFDKKEIIDFIDKDFDLLISYYDVEKTPLSLVTHLSKATFKVGFASIDKRLNHFMIDTNAEKHKIFIKELYKYLKILNKL